MDYAPDEMLFAPADAPWHPPAFDLHGRAILFLDDFTRTPVNGLTHHVLNRHWLRALLATQLEREGAELREWQGDSRPEETRAFMALMGLPASPEGWAATTMVDPLPDGARHWLEARLGDADLVVGFELPVFLLRYLADNGIGFLDVGIDAVRFARDLFFTMRTNVPALEAILRAHQLDEAMLWTDAALLRATAARLAGRSIGEPAAHVAVFFGQTRIDRALVRHGRLARPVEQADAIAESVQDCDTLLIRPHPLESDLSLLQDLQTRLPAARFTQASSYALLACDNVRRVVSLSSSLLTEAQYFGKPATRLLVPDGEGPSSLFAKPARHYRLGTSVLAPGFWRGEALAGPITPDLLRQSLGIAWGRAGSLHLEPPPRGSLLRRGLARLRGR